MRRGRLLLLGAAAAAALAAAWPAVRTLAGQLTAGYVLMGLALPLCRRLERRLPPSAAAGAALALLGAGAALLLLVMIPPLVRQFRLFTGMLPPLAEKVKAAVAQGEAWLTARGLSLTALMEELGGQWAKLAGSAASLVADGTARLVSGAAKWFLAPLFAYYLLRDRKKICAGLLTLLPVKWRTRAVRAAREMRRETAGYLRGQLLISCAVGTLTALALLATGTPGWLMLGLLMGVMELIPYAGPLLAGIPAVLLSLQNGPVRALWTLLALLAVQQAESSFLAPRLLSGATRLHPLAVLMTVTAGGVLAGTPGMLLALPLVVCVRGALRGWR